MPRNHLIQRNGVDGHGTGNHFLHCSGKIRLKAVYYLRFLYLQRSMKNH